MSNTNYNAAFVERKKLTLNANHESITQDEVDDLDSDENWAILNGNKTTSVAKNDDALSNTDLVFLLRVAQERIESIKESVAELDEKISRKDEWSAERFESIKQGRHRAGLALKHAKSNLSKILLQFNVDRTGKPVDNVNISEEQKAQNLQLQADNLAKQAENLKKKEENLLLERERITLASDMRIKETAIKHAQRLKEIEAGKHQNEDVIKIQNKAFQAIYEGIEKDYLTLEAIKKIIDACRADIKKCNSSKV